MLRIGLLGAGYMGQMHAACYAALQGPDAALAAVADVLVERAEKAAAPLGAAAYPGADELLEQAGVDAVDICLPTYLHTGYAVAAMRAGKDVFIEKPVCLSGDEAQLLLDTQRQTGARVMVGQCIRFWDEYVWLKQAALDGAFGKIQSAVFQRLSPRPGWAWNNWLHNTAQSGGVGLDMHVHDADCARWLMGEPGRLAAAAGRDADGVMQQIFTSYDIGGIPVTAEACWDYPDAFPFSMSYRIKFEKATAVFDSSRQPALMVYPHGGEGYEPRVERAYSGKQAAGGNISSLGGYYNELSYFIQRLSAGQPIEAATLEDGVGSVLLCLREIEAAGGC